MTGEKPKIPRDVIDQATRMSPVPFLRQKFGNDVKESRNGQSVSVNHVLRADYRNGKWIACDWYGSGIGDNINIVRHVTGCNFEEAVMSLVGHIAYPEENIPRPMPTPTAHRRRRVFSAGPRLTVPHFLTKDKPGYDVGRQYLLGRGIDLKTIIDAENEGAIGYLENAVAFLGRGSAGGILYVALRHFEMQTNKETGESYNKRDLAGSQKRFPMLLSMPVNDPSVPADVFIVEGGVNALAMKMIADKESANAIVFTTGSVGARVWMDNIRIKEILNNAGSITIMGENEKANRRKDAATQQADIDEIRNNVKSEVEEMIGHRISVTIAYPPKGYEDISDYVKSLSSLDIERNQVSYCKTPSPMG